MSDKIHGVTPTGVVVKRLDTILDELHDDLSDGWDINTRLNPQSYLNVQLTTFADKIAELWEFGEEVYHSMYPFSAEGASLDNAAQFGGSSRDEPRPSIYPIHAEAIDGTTIPQGSIIRSNTNPTIHFLSLHNTVVDRNSFNTVKIRVAVVQINAIYTVVLNGALFSYTSVTGDTEASILAGIVNVINTNDFTAVVTGNILEIASVDLHRSNRLVLSGNLTTESVTGIVNYASEENGDVALPSRTITEIVTDVGLISVINFLPHIPGRTLQDDTGLRQSYIDRIFVRSTRMTHSIRSAILNNVQGAVAVAGYENDTDSVDAYGRWAHSVEMVVDGGNPTDIALQIFDKKAAGIQSFGGTEVVVPGNEGEPVTIRFNRPEYVHVWFRIVILQNQAENLPPNYVEVIESIIVDAMSTNNPGVSIIPQRLIEGRIFTVVPGIAHISTATFSTTNATLSPAPGDFVSGIIPITPRQRAVTDAARIEVILGG